jgi:hypothetical protein
MSPSSIFLIQAFVIVAVPVVLLRISGLKGLLPLVAVQIMLGIALGPSFLAKWVRLTSKCLQAQLLCPR